MTAGNKLEQIGRQQGMGVVIGEWNNGTNSAPPVLPCHGCLFVCSGNRGFLRASPCKCSCSRIYSIQELLFWLPAFLWLESKRACEPRPYLIGEMAYDRQGGVPYACMVHGGRNVT